MPDQIVPSQNQYPLITQSGDKVIVEHIPATEKEIADYYIETLNPQAVAKRFNITIRVILNILKHNLTSEYVLRKLKERAGAEEVTKQKILSVFNEIIEGRKKADKNLIAACREAAKIIGAITQIPQTAIQININPHQELEDEEIDRQIERRFKAVVIDTNAKESLA